VQRIQNQFIYHLHIYIYALQFWRKMRHGSEICSHFSCHNESGIVMGNPPEMPLESAFPTHFDDQQMVSTICKVAANFQGLLNQPEETDENG